MTLIVTDLDAMNAAGESTPPKRGEKALILEHLMAARRMGFAPMFEALSHDSLRTGLMDGSLSGVAFFSNLVLPLIEAQRRKDAFAMAAIVRSASPLLDKETGIDRTRRLFYVTCSRAEEGLAIVAYSESPGDVRQHLVREGWFEEKEIELVAP